jgi:nucleotide-binding universal stress UspA family protein
MTELKRILVPLDGSSLAERAIPLATSLAKKFGSEILLLQVLDIPVAVAPTSHVEVTIGWVREARAQAHQQARNYLDAQQQEIYRDGIPVRGLVRDRSAAEDILEVATSEAVDLIIMSPRGRGAQARWTFGGVADKIVRHSPCPVLLARYAGKDVDAS